MDASSQQTLAQLIRSQRIASLGTLHDGTPLVSMVLYAPAADFSSFYIHISNLAQHTQDILKDQRVGLMIVRSDQGQSDPQRLQRVSILSRAVLVPATAADYGRARRIYLEKFPEAAMTFELGGFDIYQLAPQSARYVAGFGKTFNLGLQDFRAAAGDSPVA
jgi:heme iron utilization protein